MIQWWSDLTAVNQVFYAAAAFFSLIFLWQFISSLVGLSGGEADLEVDADMDVDVDGGDMDIDGGDGLEVDDIEAHSLEAAAESTAAFKVLTLRAILAFFTLFFWAGAMYLNMGKSLSRALLYATAWGVAAWLIVAHVVNWMRRLAESGTARLVSCVGTNGSVYLDVPAGGQGEVRLLVSGRVSMVKARAVGGVELKSGTAVRVVRVVDPTSVEVRPVESPEERKENEE